MQGMLNKTFDDVLIRREGLRYPFPDERSPPRAIQARSRLRFSHHEQSVVVLVTGQFHDLINVVACLAQALLNALEQGRFTVPRPPFTGGFERQQPFPPA